MKKFVINRTVYYSFTVEAEDEESIPDIETEDMYYLDEDDYIEEVEE